MTRGTLYVPRRPLLCFYGEGTSVGTGLCRLNQWRMKLKEVFLGSLTFLLETELKIEGRVVREEKDVCPDSLPNTVRPLQNDFHRSRM